MCNQEEKLDDLTKENFMVLDFIKQKVINGEFEIVEFKNEGLGDGVKQYGEGLIIKFLYTCKMCMHKCKDSDKCSFDETIHEQICKLFDRVI